MFKIDTREKFTSIVPESDFLSDNLTEEFEAVLVPYLEKEVKNIILNLKNVQTIDENMAQKLAEIQSRFYEHHASFVICEVQEGVEKTLEMAELTDIMNITPTESEAWDIVQMEEIERELLDDDEPWFTDHKDDILPEA
ncbi:MAG: STAS domain-containing protein [Pseudomonadota bacterium]